MRKLVALISALLILLLPVLTAADAALAQNGGFEAVSGGMPEDWYFDSWLNDGTSSAAAAQDAARGACAYIVNFAEDDARLCQQVSVKPNSYYRISCYIKVENVLGGAGANVSVLDSLASSAELTGTADWQPVELIGKTARGQKSMTVCVRLGGYSAVSSGEAWFDDIAVEKLSAKPAEFLDFSPYTQEAAQQETQQGVLPYMGLMILLTLFTLLAFALCQKYFICRPGLSMENKRRPFAIAYLLGAAFLLRLIIALKVYGHPTDINCFMAWAETLAQNGISGFYTSGMFADYTPGYMYILWLCGSLARLLGLSYGGTGYMLLIKMPVILADLLAAFIVYRLAEKRLPPKWTLLIAAFIAFNPVMAFLSGGWGQIDQVLALLLLAAIYLFEEKRLIWAGVAYGLAVLVKPQALMVGPLLAAAYITCVARAKKAWWKELLRSLAAVAAALAVIYLASLPFKSTQEPLWIVHRYFNTATSYPYASVEAFNLMALLSGNWTPVTNTIIGGLSYGALGTVLMALCVGFTGVMYVFGSKRERRCLTLCAAYLLCGLFMVGQYMHERYMFPALLLLLLSAVYYRDRRLYAVFGWFSAATLLNALCAFVIVSNQSARGTAYDVLTVVGSLMNLATFAYFTHVCCDITFKGRILQAFPLHVPDAEDAENKPCCQLPPPAGRGPRFEKRDHLYCWILTAIYAIVALVNLGTMQAPETIWYGEAGDVARIEFTEAVQLSDIRAFGGLYTGSMTLTADDGTMVSYDEDNGEMYRWQSIGGEGVYTTGFDIQVTSGQIWLNELAFFDAAGAYVAAASPGAPELTDEPDQTPDNPSYLNGMYFDELYHARTAYEHLQGLEPYENSHPPLGKVFIMLGIAIFGMNTLGWRIVGTLFGIGMVPLIYLFAKRLFKRPEYALLAGTLFAFDFMHFTQTRIATIDVYGVFFIILMFYFMYEYYRLNFHVDGLKATLKPLALSGLFFGLGAASKWICMYAGVGLAVILFTSLAARWVEYARLKDSDPRVRDCLKNTVITLLWCCVFFIALPVLIYLASYIPYYLCQTHYDLKGVWDVQKFMFNYHSQLTATHPYSSAWWQWPLSLRPVWYHVSYDVAEGNISTISAFGNPALWWPCAVGTAVLLIRLLCDRIRQEKGMFVALVGVGANYLPWVLITRCTFLYHYFASVPFVLLCTLYVLKDREEKNPNWRWVKWAWMGLALVLFGLFYPVISGLECSRLYVSALEWLPSWTFMGF